MIADTILVLSVILLTTGVYFKYGPESALISVGVYLGLIAFSMASKRVD